MSVYSNVTEQDLNKLRQLAEQQKDQRALKIKQRILKQTLDVKLAESLSPITKQLDVINESTKQLGELVKKSHVDDRDSQTPTIGNVTVSESLRDTLAFMKGTKVFFKLEVKPNGRVYWNDVIIKPVRENTIEIFGKKYDITPSIQNYFINTRATTKLLNDNEK